MISTIFSSIRISAIVLVITVSMSLGGKAMASDDVVWVRVFQAEQSTVRQHALLADQALANYGNMLFGQIDRATAESLRDQGLAVSISQNPFVLTLGEEQFDPLERFPQGNELLQASQPGWYLVQFDGPVRSRWLSELRDQGIRVAQPIYPFSYVVWMEPEQLGRVSQVDAVRWMGQWHSDWALLPQQRSFDDEIRSTMALASAHADLRTLQQALGSLGQVHSISPLDAHFRVVHMDLPGSSYAELASLPEIYTVQWIRPEVATRGEMSNQSVVGNYDQSGVVFPGYTDWLDSTGFNGSGVRVGVVDNGIRITHVDLADRIVPCQPSGDTPTSCTSAAGGHGTHVAGAIAGTGATGALRNGFLSGQGVAPGANLVRQDYNPFTTGGLPGMIPDGMAKIYRESALSGALLTNNSWGPTGSPQGYDIPTRQIDLISRDARPQDPGQHPILAVWSVMNGNGDSSGACAPSSLGSPDEAKNLFAVGSTSLQTGAASGAQVANIFRVSPNSGHGPACDGRRVPHIVAPGCRTDSTTSSSNTAHSVTECGTSMASPVVSGAVAIWAEKYIDQFGVNPSPALVKAVFTAAAQDLVGNVNADGQTMGHRPDRFQGYGRLDLDLVMNHGLEVFLYDQDFVFNEAGQSWSVNVTAVDPDQPIRIMLAWTDAPGHGNGGTTPAWVNNLDLAVSVQGQTYFGNNIGTDGWSQAGGQPDDRNNLEGVFLAPAQHAGDSVGVLVSATDLAGDALNPWNPGDPSQDFALACYNCLIGDPSFSLGTASTTAEACAAGAEAEEIVRQINVASIGPFEGLISFDVADLPTGVTSVIDPVEVEAPAQVNWTLSVSDSAEAGEYAIKLSGSSDDIVRDLPFSLTVSAPLVDGPDLEHPADSAADLVLRPTFSWQLLAGAGGYRIQVADDADFASIVLDSLTDEATFRPETALEKDQVYYWRVAGENLCGEGNWSDGRSFSTRLDPSSAISDEALSFKIAPNAIGSQALTLSNTGTGNLTFQIYSDQVGAGRDDHDQALDEVLAIENFSLPGQGNYETSAFAGDDSRGQVVGFSFQGTVSGISGNGTWASDLVLTLTSPEGVSYTVGGYQSGNPAWDFDGSGSNNNGTYSSTHIGPAIFGADGVNDLGEWDVSFDHTWNDTMNWSDVTITLHKQPLPLCREDVTPADWLSATPMVGSVAEGDMLDIAVEVDSTGLDAGDYLAYLCMATNDPDAELVLLAVELTVDPLAEPVITVSPGELAQSVLADDQAQTILEIANSGGALLEWSLAAAEPDASYTSRIDHREAQPLALPRGGSRARTQGVSGHFEPLIRGNGPLLPITGNWSEGFEDIAILPDAGWVFDNRSDPLGPAGWFQGVPEEFEAQAGPDDSYVAANFLSTIEDGVGTISNWLISPVIALSNGTEIRFWTRTMAESEGFEDRLQVRLSSAGDSTDVGNSATSVGDFSELLLDINPTYSATGYPREWTEYVLVIEGVSEPSTGRVAFRYFVENSGGQGSNGDYLGIDTFSVTQPDLVGCQSPTSLPWLSFNPSSGETAPGDTSQVTVTLDASGLEEGPYHGLLCLESNDPATPLVEVPVLMNVAGDDVFADRFEN